MPGQHSQTIHKALQQTPGYEDLQFDALKITRQGGLTNLVFRVDVLAAELPPVIVRLPGDGTEEYIDRNRELTNALAAARTGVAPEILHSNPDEGLLVMKCVDGITTMTPEEFARIQGSPARAGIALHQLHSSGETFEGRFELFAMIDEYLDVLDKKGNCQMPDGYKEAVASAQPIKDALAASSFALAPCHCDPLCENFLDDGEKMWIVDYEYGGMNDPLWDLGDLAVEGHFTEAMELEMLMAYFDREPTQVELGRFMIYKAMCDLLWTLWGLIQHADENPAEDFWAYATTRFERCKALMARPDFNDFVEAVRVS